MFSDSSGFVHLHVHTTYSFLDSAVDISKLIKRVKSLNMPAIGITDHGNMHGVLEFADLAFKEGIKPIIGCEFYLAPHDRKIKQKNENEENYSHLICLAKNQEGYDNMIKLASTAYIDGLYYKPRIDKQILADCSKGIIASSACIIGDIPRAILKGNIDEAIYLINEYKEIFGVDNFFLELMDHGIPEEKRVNEKLIELSKKTDTPLIATNDIHYINREDAEVQDVYLCIGTGKKLSDTSRLKFPGCEFYLKSSDEMRKLFEHIPEALRNTLHIAEKISFSIKSKYDENIHHLPVFNAPNDKSEAEYLKELCYEGLKNRYENITPELKERLDYEISVIIKMRFPGYFLIVSDFINWAKKNDIYVGPGRGSAAGSIVAYTLGITDIDPLKYGLLFERFLNPDRVSMPDIDTDFEDEGRERVIEYVREKYGSERVSHIITYGTLKSRSVVRDVGRVFDLPIKEVDKIAKFIPSDLKMTLQKAWEESPDLKAILQSNRDYMRMYEIAKKLEGLRRQPGIHAAGIIIGDDNLVKYVPLYKDTKKGSIATQFEGTLVDKCGLLKMDFLGLKNLTVIKKCLKYINQNTGKTIDLNKLTYNDEKTYKLLQSGKTLGVFQVESDGMRELIKSLLPDRFEEIIALIALYRPGPLNSGMDKTFIRRKFKREKVEYPHKDLEEVLSETYGVFIYQEQVMKIAQIIGGFSMAKADELRKAMGKKDTSKMASLKDLFIKGAVNKKYKKDFADKLYNDMAEFAEYGFNKSHSAAYAVIVYLTAYLKANYPTEYMCALLTANKDDSNKIASYIKEAKDINIEILPPDINFSLVEFSIEKKNKIRFALSALQNLGETASNTIVEERLKKGLFKSLYDFLDRIDLFQCNKKVIESLTKAGGFDSISKNRASVFASIEYAISLVAKNKQMRATGQLNLFGASNQIGQDNIMSDELQLVQIPEWHDSEKLQYEKEILGIYLSSHPLIEFEDYINFLSTHNTVTIKNLEDNEKVKIAGILSSVQKKVSKKNPNEKYGIVTLEDFNGIVEALIFRENFRQCEQFLKQDLPVLIEGSVKVDSNDKHSIFVNSLKPLSEIDLPKIEKFLHIELHDDEIREDRIHSLRDILSAHRGRTSVLVHLHDENNVLRQFRLGDNYKVTINKDLRRRLQEHSCVKYIYETELCEGS